MAFSEVYRKGDFKLWSKAMEQGPVTLDQWKAAVQRAFMMRQAVVEGKKALLRNASQTNSFHSSSSSPTGVARVHHVEASRATISDSDEDEGEGEEVVSGEKLQQIGSAKKGTSGPKTGAKEKKKFVNSFAERQKFLKRGQCFHCYKLGHRFFECPDADKPARRPTAEELNL
jgi:hypothetical protein